MKNLDTITDHSKPHSTEFFIDFLCKNIGASRDEIMEVVNRSGISARRIAEYILHVQAGKDMNVSDD